MRELVFGSTVATPDFSASTLTPDWELSILDAVVLLMMELAPRDTGKVEILPLWMTEISLVFMARPLLSMMVYWFHTAGSTFPEGDRISLGSISGTRRRYAAEP